MKINLNGKEEEVSENVYAKINLFFNTLEVFRLNLCDALGIDYLSTNDGDIVAAVKAVKRDLAAALLLMYSSNEEYRDADKIAERHWKTWEEVRKAAVE